MTETKQHLQALLDSLVESDRKVTGWREEVSRVIKSGPGWIDEASSAETIAVCGIFPLS